MAQSLARAHTDNLTIRQRTSRPAEPRRRHIVARLRVLVLVAYTIYYKSSDTRARALPILAAPPAPAREPCRSGSESRLPCREASRPSADPPAARSYRNLSPRARLGLGAALLAWGVVGLQLSDRAGERLGILPPDPGPAADHDGRDAIPRLTVVDRGKGRDESDR